MKCTVCRAEVDQLNEQTKAHMLITKSAKDGHIHVHGDLASKENCQEMIETAIEEVGLVYSSPAKQKVPGEVVFHNRQRIGDMLVFTCGVRDFKAAFPHVRVNVISTAAHLWDHNPNIDRSLVPTEGNTVKIGPKRLTNASNRLDWHFTNAFRVSIEDALGVHIPQGESRPDIYLTQEEYDAPRTFRDPYWIICTSGEKGWGTKMYPHVKWQEVVDQLPDIKFVQIGTAEDNAPRLIGPNVIDHIGKTQSKETGVRDLIKLFLNAEGSIGLVSFHMHLSAALYKPSVVVAGAREPVHFTRYPGHAYLATDGQLPCATKACWHCAIDACTNLVMRPDHEGKDEKVPKCVDIISAKDVVRAINGFYEGGRLVRGVPCAKPVLKGRVVPTPPKLITIVMPEEVAASPYPQLPFNGGSLTARDWAFIKGIIDQYGVKTVLEFGAGLSTLLFNDACPREVTTYETNVGWIQKIQGINPKAFMIAWAGVEYHDNRRYDLAFVDGPAGDKPREISTKAASEWADLVVVHDAGREWARKYQDQYLKAGFDGPIKGGHRCHLWVKKTRSKADLKPDTQKPALGVFEGVIVPPEPLKTQINGIVAPSPSKFVKIVSTARGWGGCARSVTTIMDFLLKGGHKVEFIPFRNAVTSSEWKAALAGSLANVKVTADYSTLQEECDVLLMYADDYIWEFGKPEIAEAFSNIGAQRKIMMLNYRRGKVGELPWTRGWDKYMFLNSTQERELLGVLPGAQTKVLPPCTVLEPFFVVQPNYGDGLRLVRHSSQGNVKFPPEEQCINEFTQILGCRKDVEMHMLPGPTFMAADNERFFKWPRTADSALIARFLSIGNCFWYRLPEGYMDMGPRVIVEAMAAGLPVIADRWGGAVDRVVDGETGVLCASWYKHIEAIRQATPKELKRHGENARQRAHDEFRPEAWITELFEDKHAGVAQLVPAA